MEGNEETPREPARPAVAVLIPCYNEELTIARVVEDFRAQLPRASIYVFDNNSSDRSVEVARRAGAIVRHERRQGKGHVVQAMFRKVDADIYIMVDGDDTYPAEMVAELIEPIRRGEADMAIGSRLHREAASQFRILNRIGNVLYRRLLNSIFGVQLTDLLTGYRVLSRQLVRSLPLVGGGFETEAEMTIKAIERGFRIVEVPVSLRPRPPGSHSKIRLVQDGWLILNTILTLFRDYKPLTFFGGLGLVLLATASIPGGWAVADYLRTGQVPRPALAVVAGALSVLGVLVVLVGVILHAIVRRFQESDRQWRNMVEDLSGDRSAGRAGD